MAEHMLGEYVAHRLIARSAVAEVWAAVDPDLDRPLAIKAFLPHFLADPTFAPRFRRQAKRLAALHHPAIVRVFDFALLDTQALLMMEYLPGGTLAARLDDLARRGQTLPPQEVAALLDAVAGALDYAHAQGVLHGDLRPANILFNAEGDPVVCDFGVAQIVAAGTGAGEQAGDAAYRAPEQAAGGEITAAGDLYAAGALLHVLLTGHAPGELSAGLSTAAPVPNLSPAVQEVLARATSVDPAARFPSGRALVEAYRAALAAPVKGTASVEIGDADASPPHAPWLRPLLGASALAAALLGRNAPSADNLPSDRRGLFALLLTTLGIFVAGLQFVLNMFSLFDRSARLLASTLPYVIVLLFLGGLILSVNTLARSNSALRRRQAGGLLAVILVVLAGWGGWWTYARLKPPEGFVILIGDFEAEGTEKQIDVARYISQSLEQELRHLDGLAGAVRSGKTYKNADEARRAGIEHDATLVIWGWYDAGGISPRIEVMDIPDLDAGLNRSRLLVKAAGFAPIPGAAAALGGAGGPNVTDISTFVYQPAVLPSVDLFIQNGPQELNYAASAILGIAFYANGDAEHARELLDRALTLSEPLEDASAIGKGRIYFQRATIDYDEGRLADAAADLERAVAIQPDLYEAHYNLAMVYAQLCDPARRLPDAVKAAEQAVALEPDKTEARRLLGDLYLQQGRTAEAIAALEQAAEQEPDEPSTFDQLASAYNAAGRTEAAVQAAQQALALYEQAALAQPADPLTAHLDLGYAHLRAEEYDRALDEFNTAAVLAPDDAAVHRALGNVYYWQGNADQAIAEYRRWAELAPKDGDAPLLLGLTLSEQGDLAGAIAGMKQAAALNVCDTGPYLILAGLYWQDENLADSAVAYEQAAAIEPDNAETYQMLGNIRYFEGNLPAAQAALEKSVALDPTQAESYRTLGIVYMDEEDYVAAAKNWARLAELAPDEALSFTSLGSVYLVLQEWQGAADAYRRALELEPSADSRASLAVALYQLGDIDGAAAQLEQALVDDPDNAGAHSTLGDAYFRQGRLDDAADQYRAALAVEDRAYPRSQLASIYVAQDRQADALDELQRAVDLEPDNWYYRYLLGDFYAQTGDLDAAVAGYEAALDLNPQAAAASYGLGLAAYRQCRLSAASKAIGQAVALDNGATTYLGLQAAIYWAQNRVEEADAIYRNLQAAPPDDWIAHLSAGDYFYQTGDLDAAAQQFQTLLEAGDATPLLLSLAYTALGKVYYAQDRLLPAAAEYESALASFPANAEAQTLLGDIDLRNGDPAAAAQAYDAALELLPSYGRFFPPDTSALLEVSIALRRGLALDRLAQTAEADAARAHALEAAQAFAARSPNSPAANAALVMAYQALGDSARAQAAYAAALQCDGSIAITFARFQEEMAKLQ